MKMVYDMSKAPKSKEGPPTEIMEKMREVAELSSVADLLRVYLSDHHVQIVSADKGIITLNRDVSEGLVITKFDINTDTLTEALVAPELVTVQ